jgi:hypothetical protein
VIAPESFADRVGLRGTTDRASYLIDRFRVIYEFGGGWTCGCREFASQDSCKHTREAAGRRAAQLSINQYLRQHSPEALSFSTHKPAAREPPNVSYGNADSSPARRLLHDKIGGVAARCG